MVVSMGFFAWRGGLRMMITEDSLINREEVMY